MKKNRILITSLLMLLFATYSCAVEEMQPETKAISDKITKNVNPVFLQHDLSAYKIKPIWDSFITFENDNAVEINFIENGKLLVPMSENQKVQGRRRLLLSLKDGKVNETIIEYIPSNDFKGIMRDISNGNFKAKQFDGKIVFRNAKSDIRTYWYVTNGKITAKGTTKKSKKKNNGIAYRWIQTSHEECDAVYYIVTAGDGEGFSHFSHFNCQTVYSEYWEDEEPVDPSINPPYDPYDCAVNPFAPWCQDGGGPINLPVDPPVDECVDFDPNSDNYSETAELISSVLISNNGSIVKKHYTWRCGKGIWYDVYSVEEGELEFTGNSNLPYKWISLEHQGCYIEGGMICGSASIGLDTGVSNVGIYSATMQLAIGINSAYTAAGTPVNRYFALSPIKHFNSNE